MLLLNVAKQHKYLCHTKRTNMKVIKWIKSLFEAGNQYHTEVERFIVSKNPTSTVELEAWLKYYEQNKFKRMWI